MPFNDISNGVFTVGATGNVDGYCTTHLNGTINEVYLSVDKPASVATVIKVIGEESTRKVLLYVADPSTLGRYYYPGQATWSTAGTPASTYGLAQPRLRKERPRVIADCTSGITTVTVRVYAD